MLHVGGYGKIGCKKNKMSTDRESGRGNKKARVTRGSRNPKHSKKKALHRGLSSFILLFIYICTYL
jgi:hypothetical protein